MDEWVILAVKRHRAAASRPEDLPHVFERFHRGSTTHARSAEGSGIGLSLVQELVQLHGGTIGWRARWIAAPRSLFACAAARRICRRSRSALRAGRTSRPVPPPTSKRCRAGSGRRTRRRRGAASIQSAGGQQARLRRRSESAERILVVDDNADMRRYLRRILQEHWKVDTATDGMVALGAHPQVPAGPGHRGPHDARPRRPLTRRRHCAMTPRLADTPVMVLSARANEDASIDALSAGADDYLPKPFSARELIARVAVQLARMRLRRAERAAREVAEQSSFMKDELVLMLSSSLRSPLNAMLSTLDAAQGSVLRQRGSPARAGSHPRQHAASSIASSTKCTMSRASPPAASASTKRVWPRSRPS